MVFTTNWQTSFWSFWCITHDIWVIFGFLEGHFGCEFYSRYWLDCVFPSYNDLPFPPNSSRRHHPLGCLYWDGPGSFKVLHDRIGPSWPNLGIQILCNFGHSAVVDMLLRLEYSIGPTQAWLDWWLGLPTVCRLEWHHPEIYLTCLGSPGPNPPWYQEPFLSIMESFRPGCIIIHLGSPFGVVQTWIG